jgi:stage II sporulation protein D
MSDRILTTTTFLLAISLFPYYLSSKSDRIRIYLKIFAKRNFLSIENASGLYVGNNKIKLFKKLDLQKKDTYVECNGRLYTTLFVIPKVKTLTKIITRYGSKSYDGSFTIRLKDDSFYIINTTSMNSYLQGVVGSELGNGFNLETLKAQAVVSRSYFMALRKKTQDRDFDAIDVAGQFQAYRGLHHAGPLVKRAVLKTNREVIHTGDDGFVPYFHSTCGGMLLTPGEAWGKDEIVERPGFRRFDGSAESPNCRISPYFRWSADLKKKLILGAMSKQLNMNFTDINFFVNNNGFLKQVRLFTSDGGTVTISGFKFKSYLEKKWISSVRSTRLTVRIEGETVHFKGRGFGHFVGMCQWGAENLARKGMNYRDILRYYFPKASIVYLNECP